MKEILFVIAGIVLGLIFTGMIAFTQASLEARTFNKFSQQQDATLWDAMFADLRIEACRN